MGDLNNDGYYDFVTNNAMPHETKLYQNTAQSNNYFAFSLQGTLSNKDGIGSWVHCYAGGNHYVRFTLCGENLIGQNSAKTIFGLGTTTIIDSLVIEWNRGTKEVYYDLTVNQHMHFIEGVTFSLPFSISVSEDEFICPGDSVVLDAGEHDSYLWNTSHTERFLTVFEPGWYQVTVTSPFGLPIMSNPVIIENAPQAETEIIVQDISCFGLEDGAISINISNAPVQSIEWSNDMQQLSINNLEAGVYSFMAYDSYGCLVIGNAVINEPLPLSAQTETNSASCFGAGDGLAIITASGGTIPYTFSCLNCTLNQLPAGNHFAILTDSNGCSLEIPVIITQPDQIEISLELNPQIENGQTGSAQAFITGGTPPYNVFWSNGASGVSFIDELETGLYAVTVEDFNGCTAVLNFEITFISGVSANSVAPIKLFPNPAVAETALLGIQTPIVHVYFYNAHGQLVKSISSHPIQEKIALNDLASGIYWVHIDVGYKSFTTKLMVIESGQ
jgi:hypothetical protein